MTVRVLSIGSLPPEWGGPVSGGVATLHATLLEGFARAAGGVEIVGVAPPAPLAGEPPLPIFTRPEGTPTARFYEDLLERLRPDAVVMHHFANAIGLAHARLVAPPPAVGVAHSWHNITFRSGDERRRAHETTQEALGGLAAVVGGSRHCLEEGAALGLRYPPVAEAIHHPLQRLYLAGELDAEVGAHRRDGIAYVGELCERKRPAALVEAAARLPGATVALAGHGALDGPLRALVADRALGERVTIGHRSAAEVRALLLRSEAMCLPSASESFGLAYSEALACGTPVIGFAPTVREIGAAVGADVGEPLEDARPEAIAAAIERVRMRDWDRAELRRRAVEAFDLDRAAHRYAELLGRVAGRATAGRA